MLSLGLDEDFDGLDDLRDIAGICVEHARLHEEAGDAEHSAVGRPPPPQPPSDSGPPPREQPEPPQDEELIEYEFGTDESMEVFLACLASSRLQDGA
jgi:hypothetical protein